MTERESIPTPRPFADAVSLELVWAAAYVAALNAYVNAPSVYDAIADADRAVAALEAHRRERRAKP